MKILGIESSCDETAAAVLECTGDSDFEILSNRVASQIEMHARYGGVVPEIASRAHCEIISKLVYDTLSDAKIGINDIDAIAVTAYPGLIGALLVGVNFAKGLAYANSKPLIAVDHIKGHIASIYLTEEKIMFPYIALVASGGHTSIIKIDDYNSHVVIGGTRDDAMGEAFDKVARVMGMPYPGGAAMDKLAYEGKSPVPFPTAAIRDGSLDLSFSGIKTAVLNYINSSEQRGEEINKANIAAGFVNAAVSSAYIKLEMALNEYPETKAIAIAGGVSANSHLREAIGKLCEKHKIDFYKPQPSFCGDNGAMIAAAGYFEYKEHKFADLSLNADASKWEV
ncbi:MAG: tRNA (adenosine(37)-N6)-threonylcarbamoyltransferase complex transferase subunit TsaD [Clostridia bacterium]|nr:tRNA (adenosine(37)-N6)-threonylcarbamoyltransferase complex transferase subunit TsaD [Clostridia bacterium]